MAALDFHKLEAVFCQLAREAGDAIMQIYTSGKANVISKPDQSPVTAADYAADEIIFARLSHAFPDIAIVSEERAESHLLEADIFFIVDPLDGTKEFIQRSDEFTVNIALISQGRPLRGIVSAPALGKQFFTRADGQAVMQEGTNTALPLAPAHPDINSLRVVSSKSHLSPLSEAYLSSYAIGEHKTAGSSLKFCMLAAGQADLYPRFGRTMEWDTAAGQAVLEATGGQVIAAKTNMPLRYGKKGFENPHFVAYVDGVM